MARFKDESSLEDIYFSIEEEWYVF
jgi:hypothetical protein